MKITEAIQNAVSDIKKDPSLLYITKHNILHDNVLIAPVDASTTGVIRPKQYEDKSETGLVISVGPGFISEKGELIPVSVKPGDLVYYGKYSSYKIREERQDLHIVRNEDIISSINYIKLNE